VSAPLLWPRQSHAAARHVQELVVEIGSDFSLARPTQYLKRREYFRGPRVWHSAFFVRGRLFDFGG